MQEKVQILTDVVLATGNGHKKRTPSEDTSKSVEGCREDPNFVELFRLREENFELKREIQRMDHALQIAKDLELDLVGASCMDGCKPDIWVLTGREYVRD